MNPAPSPRSPIAARPAPHRSLPRLALASLLGMAALLALGQAVAADDDRDAPGTEAQTRGPVHEAFAGIVTFNPQPGVVVPRDPPAPIEELPPAERPEGGNVTWIPGYWAWDDERSDFLWVSGTWRALPPGRAWMAGYWAKTAQGHQWISGYWADAASRQTTYLPPPPTTVEAGPNVAAPSPDYGWAPGCWIWYDNRYAWQPGYWVAGRADWDWTPAHYVWSPRGCIFVGGFWDFPIERRGVLFAPIHLETAVYARPGFFFSPRIVINLGVFSDHLFLRPRYHHYYFGDYYAPSYFQGGFYASFTFQSSHHGYDPIYSHHRWEHRQDRDWGRRVEASYQNRRDHESARPPRTWTDQRALNARLAPGPENRVAIATPFSQLTRRTDTAMRFQPVATEERQQLSTRSRDVQSSREERRALEAQPAAASPVPGRPVERERASAIRVQQPQSPIVAPSPRPTGLGQRAPAAPQAPPSTQAPQAPKPSRGVQPRSTSTPTPAPAQQPGRGQGQEPIRQQPSPPAPTRTAPVEKGASRLLRGHTSPKPSPPSHLTVLPSPPTGSP